MILSIDECHGLTGGDDLLQDLVEFQRVDKLVEACMNHTAKFSPLWLSVHWSDKCYEFCRDGRNAKDAEKNLRALKRTRAELRDIMNDRIYISVDVFEQELVIYLDGKPGEPTAEDIFEMDAETKKIFVAQTFKLESNLVNRLNMYSTRTGVSKTFAVSEALDAYLKEKGFEDIK